MADVTKAKRSRARQGGDSGHQGSTAQNANHEAVNVRGNSGDPNRGTWCTPKPIAIALGRFDLDPFSNPRSHILADTHCMLEDGGDGLHYRKAPGSWRCGATREIGCADADTRTFIQPPYSIVEAALDHYGHTRFTALLRFDPRTHWFRRLFRMSALIGVLWEINFEPPPGVTAPGSTFPHALFYRNAEDVTPAALRRCIAWRTGHGT